MDEAILGALADRSGFGVLASRPGKPDPLTEMVANRVIDSVMNPQDMHSGDG